MNIVQIPRVNGTVTTGDLNAIIGMIERHINNRPATQDGYIIVDEETPVVIKDTGDGKYYQLTVTDGEVKLTEWSNPRATNGQGTVTTD